MGPTSFLPHPPSSSSSGCPHTTAAALRAHGLALGCRRALSVPERCHRACSLWVAAARPSRWSAAARSLRRSSAACTGAPSHVLAPGRRHAGALLPGDCPSHGLLSVRLASSTEKQEPGHACVKREARKRKSEEQRWAGPHEHLVTCSS